MYTQNKNSLTTWFVLVIIFISTFPFSLFIVIIGFIAYKYSKKFISGDLVQELQKLSEREKKRVKIGFSKLENDIFLYLRDNDSSPHPQLLEKKIEDLFIQNNLENDIDAKNLILRNAGKYFTDWKEKQKTEKALEKVDGNYERIKDKILEILIENYKVPNESLYETKLKNIFINYDIQYDTFIKQKLIREARKEFVVYKEQIRKKKVKNIPKKYDYEKNRKKSPTLTTKKYIPKKIETNTDFSSIWDEYESVIDIMERDKK